MLAEDEGVDLEPVVSLRPAQRLETSLLRVAQIVPAGGDLDARASDLLRAREDLGVVAPSDHRVHHRSSHGLLSLTLSAIPIETGFPSSSAERQAASVSSSERRLCRAEL